MLPHFTNPSYYANLHEYCSVCGNIGNVYGFGYSRNDPNFYTKILCEKHYKLFLRKEKLDRLKEIKDI